MSYDHRDHGESGGSASEETRAEDTRSAAQEMSQVKRVIAVMSGKGGVGKSLVTALLAVAFRQAGYEVGVLDADITGPSVPKMFGLNHRLLSTELGLLPVTTQTGIRAISINLLLEHPDDPVIWRGPLLANAVKQLWQEVAWGDVDVLLVDLPPGTADIPLTVMQSLPLNGLVVVASPQEVVAMVVRKAIKMAVRLNVRVLGLVENMTHLVCPRCGERIELFGSPEAPNSARAAGVPVLASISVDPGLSALCDRGMIEAYERNPFAQHRAALEALLEGAPPKR